MVLALLATSGCMTHGTHLHGDFACRAPNGTCAPMSVIDNAAVVGMGATVPTGSRASVERGAVKSGPLVFAAAGSGAPQRTTDRVLRVVFPAFVDATGTFHEESVARTVVERGGWVRDVEPSIPGAVGSAAPAVATATPPGVPAVRLASLDEAIAAVSARAKASAAPPATGTAPRIAGLAEAVGQAHAEAVEGLDPDVSASAPEVAADPSIAGASRGRHRRVHVGKRRSVSARAPVALDAARVNYTAELNRLQASRYRATTNVDDADALSPTMTVASPTPAAVAVTTAAVGQVEGQPR